jgi:hypothetical protein
MINYLVFKPRPGHAYELVRMPAEKVIASGSLEAIFSVVRLLGTRCRMASFAEEETRALCKKEDAKFLASCSGL